MKGEGASAGVLVGVTKTCAGSGGRHEDGRVRWTMALQMYYATCRPSLRSALDTMSS